jgi:hypothetical protein
LDAVSPLSFARRTLEARRESPWPLMKARCLLILVKRGNSRSVQFSTRDLFTQATVAPSDHQHHSVLKQGCGVKGKRAVFRKPVTLHVAVAASYSSALGQDSVFTGGLLANQHLSFGHQRSPCAEVRATFRLPGEVVNPVTEIDRGEPGVSHKLITAGIPSSYS